MHLYDPKFSPYFNDCIGALDGTHIPAVIPACDSRPFRNRKGFHSQNVLAVVGFDMCFTFVLAGWEGSAHDGRVLQDAMTKGFPSRQNKYYLGDAGFGLSRNVLTPYRGVRYHLKENRLAQERPQNKKELFNLRHSSLRNVIERVFGVLKKRFPLLNNMSSYRFATQVDLVLCMMILHNYIRKHQNYEDYYDRAANEEQQNINWDEPEAAEDDELHNNQLFEWRDNIAEQMWNDYQIYLRQRM
jgi:hypothetical protein